MRFRFLGVIAGAVMLMAAGSALAAEKDPCLPRVPADQLAAAKGTKSPGGDAAAGKAIFEGKGTCFTCHGLSGKGDGEAGKALDPSPRNFTNPKFQECKSDGELLWVITNGSPGTGMIPAVSTGIITQDEAWKAIAYLRSLKGK